MIDNVSDKRGVEAMFDGIARRYDLLNHLLTLGIDVWWRRRCVGMIHRVSDCVVVDVATGTCDLALELCRGLKPVRLLGLDLSQEMLDLGREKVSRAGLSDVVELRRENCESTSLPDDYCDVLTIGFGIRNFQSPELGLREFLRVLKPGGELTILEFSQPRSRVFRWLFGLYFRFVLPLIGRCVSRHPIAYTYLPASVAAFPSGRGFCDMIESAGFEGVVCRSLTFGVVTVYQGKKGFVS